MGSRDVGAGSPAPGPLRRLGLGGGALALLLAALLVAALGFRRERPPQWFGDESSHLLLASSLWSDGDRLYAAADRERFARRHGGVPSRIALEPASQGGSPRLAAPLPYALLIAPLDRLSAARGAVVFNALLLTAAALFAWRVLSRRLGGGAGWLVALFVFVSPLFRLVFLAQPEVLLLACTIFGLGLAYATARPPADRQPEIYPGPDPPLRFGLRWLGVGLLLALPAAYDPLYLLLLAPAVAAVPRQRRRLGVAVVLAAALAGLLLTGTPARWWRALGSVPAERLRVEAAQPPGAGAAGGGAPVLRWSLADDEAGAAPVRAFGWNALYFLAGRQVGVLPYFPALLLLWSGRRRGSPRLALLLAVALAALLAVLLRPFDFIGGPGAVTNRTFVPLFGALWFLPERVPRPAWLALVALLGAPFLWPLWAAPRLSPLQADGSYRHVSSAANRLLPYETTQRRLPGFESWQGSGLWLRAIRGLEPTRRADSWRFTEPSAEVLLASASPLQGLVVDLGPGSTAELEISGGEPGDWTFRADGGVALEVRFERPRARHAMWFGDGERFLYLLRLRLPPDAEALPTVVLRARHAPGEGGESS